MSDLKDQIEEAQLRVANCRRRAETPGASLEDEFALEKARNRLLTLELREFKQATARQRCVTSDHTEPKRGRPTPRSAKDVAEAEFEALYGGPRGGSMAACGVKRKAGA